MSKVKLTPAQRFLAHWTREGRMVTDVKAARCMTKHGERGLKRRARKARRKAHATRLQRVSYAADVKRAEALIAKGGPA
jgi:hypothetical protein